MWDKDAFTTINSVIVAGNIKTLYYGPKNNGQTMQSVNLITPSMRDIPSAEMLHDSEKAHLGWYSIKEFVPAVGEDEKSF